MKKKLEICQNNLLQPNQYWNLLRAKPSQISWSEHQLTSAYKVFYLSSSGLSVQAAQQPPLSRAVSGINHNQI